MVSALRLDHDRDRTQLWDAARWLQPKLLVLAPLVRLHGIDENHAGAVAELLRIFARATAAWHLGTAGAPHAQECWGWSYRRSGTAWLGQSLCVRRLEPLSPANRAAPDTLQRASVGAGIAAGHLELVATNAVTTHPEMIAALHDEKEDSLTERVLALLARGRALTRTTLCDSLAVKNERLGEVLESLERAGQIGRTSAGWHRLC